MELNIKMGCLLSVCQKIDASVLVKTKTKKNTFWSKKFWNRLGAPDRKVLSQFVCSVPHTEKEEACGGSNQAHETHTHDTPVSLVLARIREHTVLLFFFFLFFFFTFLNAKKPLQLRVFFIITRNTRKLNTEPTDVPPLPTWQPQSLLKRFTATNTTPPTI